MIKRRQTILEKDIKIVIKTENLSKKYGKGENQVTALDSVSLLVNEGEFVSVMGASGSGKSTLLNLIGGLDFPTEGSVFYYGRNIFEMKDDELSRFRLKNIGFIFQSYNLVPELTARENILLPKSIAREKADREKVEEIAGILGLSDRMDYLPQQLSGGQQQRVAIARAMINDPKVLLCDEPTGNLDKKSGENVMENLKALNRDKGITVVMITHDRQLANMTERIIEISDGRIGA